MRNFLRALSNVARTVHVAVRWCIMALTRLVAKRWTLLIEILAVLTGVGLMVASYVMLQEVVGLPFDLSVANATFLEKNDYSGSIEPYFGIRHDCGEILQAELQLRPQLSREQPPIWRRLLHAFNRSSRISAGDIHADLWLKHAGVPLSCGRIAIHVPGNITGATYTIKEESHGLVVPIKVADPAPDWAKGSDIVIDIGSNQGFRGEIGFVWKDSLVYLGRSDVGFTMPIAFLQNYDADVKLGVMTVLTEVQSPPPYQFVSGSIPLDREPRNHPQGSFHAFRASVMLSQIPLSVRLSNPLSETEKQSQLIIWSTLLGIGIGLILEGFFSVLRTINQQRRPPVVHDVG